MLEFLASPVTNGHLGWRLGHRSTYWYRCADEDIAGMLGQPCSKFKSSKVTKFKLQGFEK